MEFTVTMAIYFRDKASDFIDAVNSIYTNQTLKPSEIIIVVDGSIPNDLEAALQSLQNKISVIKVIRFLENKGHAAVRQAGLEASFNELVAIMDSDDIAEPNRFELQLKTMEENPDISALGGQIKEFIRTKDNVVGIREVPINSKDVNVYLKSRCPMNLMTVMYRKSDVEAVGGFMDWYCEEDYYLWNRLFDKGFKMANLPDTLVNVRVGKEMYQRRGGWKYFKSETRLQTYMLSHKIISLPRYFYNVLGRFVVQVAMPNSFRGIIFQKLFRK